MWVQLLQEYFVIHLSVRDYIVYERNVQMPVSIV